MLVACSLRYAYELQARRAVETMMRPEERSAATTSYDFDDVSCRLKRTIRTALHSHNVISQLL